SGWLIHVGIGFRVGSADRATFVLVIVPERPRTLDRLVLVLGTSDLPVAAALAQVGDVFPAVLAMRTPYALTQSSPGFLDCDFADIANLDLALVVDRAAHHRPVLVDSHGVVAPRTCNPEFRVVHDRVGAHRAGRGPFEHRPDLHLGAARLPVG